MHELIEKKGEILFYTTAAGSVKMEVLLEAETVWMTQKMIAELFEVKPQNITMHLKNIYKDEELIKESTCKDFLQVQKEGSRNVRRKVEYYNLDAIIAVGYRVNSLRATHSRIHQQRFCYRRCENEKWTKFWARAERKNIYKAKAKFS